MSVPTLALPAFTTTTPGCAYNTSQLLFLAATSAALWAVFVFIQPVAHRDYFILNAVNSEEHTEPPTARAAWISFALLVLALVTFVGLARLMSRASSARSRPQVS